MIIIKDSGWERFQKDSQRWLLMLSYKVKENWRKIDLKNVPSDGPSLRGGSVVRSIGDRSKWKVRSIVMVDRTSRKGGKPGRFLLQRGRLKRRDSGADVQHGQLKGSTIHPVAPVPRTEIVTCPLRRRDSNAHAYRPRSSNDERRDKRVPWRGSSGELSSTRVHTRPCLPGETHTYRVSHNQSRRPETESSSTSRARTSSEWNTRLYSVFNRTVRFLVSLSNVWNSKRSSYRGIYQDI